MGAKESGNPPLSENSRGGPVERMRVCRPHRQVCGAAGLTIAVLYRSERQIVLVLGYDGHEGSGGVAGRTDGRRDGLCAFVDLGAFAFVLSPARSARSSEDRARSRARARPRASERVRHNLFYSLPSAPSPN